MTNIFKIDTPVRRSLYFIISALISIAVIIEGQIISPYTEDFIGDNLVLMNIIEISIALFFSYLYLVNDSKRIWDICGNKRLSLVIAGCACFVKILNDVLFFLHVIDLKVGFIIFGLLALYYFVILFLPKDCLTDFVNDKFVSKPKTEETSAEVAEEDTDNASSEGSSEEGNA